MNPAADSGCDVLLFRWNLVPPSHHIVILANHFQAQQLRVELVAAVGESEAIAGLDPGFRLHLLHGRESGGSAKLLQILKLFYGLRRLVRARRPKVVYIVDSWTLPLWFAATLGRMRMGRRAIVYHTFDWLEPGLHAGIHLALEGLMCRRADLVVNTDRARARLQRTIQRLRITPLAVQNCPSRSLQVPSPDRQLRVQLLGGDTRDEARLLVYPTTVGGAGSEERMALELVEAMALLPSYHHLVLFRSVGAYADRCEARVWELGLEGRCRFLPRLELDDLLKHLVCADVGAVLYSDNRSSGYFMCNADKLGLYAACGVPVVASNYPNLASLVYRLGLGVCCDAAVPGALASSIQSLTEGGEPMRKWKDAARSAFEGVLNIEVQAAPLVRAVRGLVGTDASGIGA